MPRRRVDAGVDVVGHPLTQLRSTSAPTCCGARSPSATAIIGEAARKRLIEQLPRKVEIFSEFLNQIRFPGATHDDLVARYLAEKYTRSQ